MIEEKLVELITKAEKMGEKGIAVIAEQAPQVMAGFLHYKITLHIVGVLTAIFVIGLVWGNSKRLTTYDDDCDLPAGRIAIFFCTVIFSLVFFYNLENILHAHFSPLTFMLEYVSGIGKGGCGK